MTEQMTPANDPSVDESASTEENATPAGTVYNGEFRPDPNRPEQSEEDLALVADLEEAMRDVVDPELMVNVVDLGLVYGIQVDEANNATVDMTLTSPTCPLTDRIEYDTQTVLEGLVNSVAINWVWLPPWSLEMITDDGREQLRAIGYNV